MKGSLVPRISLSFFIVFSSRKLDQRAAPGEAAAEADYQHPAAGSDAALILQFAQNQRNAGSSGVAVFGNVLIVLLRRNVVFAHRQVDDAGIGLMEDEKVYILHRFARSFSKPASIQAGNSLHGELKDFGSFHGDKAPFSGFNSRQAQSSGQRRIDAKLLFVPAIRSFIRASLEGIRSMTVTMS